MKGVNSILNFLNLKDSLSEDEIFEITKHTAFKKYTSSQYLIKEGDTRPYLFFILKGLVRLFFIKKNGMEITSGVRFETEFIASSDSIFFDRPSRFYLQAIEDTEVLMIPYDILNNIIESNPVLLKTKIKVLEDLLKLIITRNETFTLLTPEERYLELLSSRPKVVKRIADKYLANMLGITPVSFSRIKKRVSEKSKDS